MGLTRCGRRGGTDSVGTDAVGLTRWNFHFYTLSFFMCFHIFGGTEAVGLTRWDSIYALSFLRDFHFRWD